MFDRPCSILIVDDEIDLCESIQFVFDDQGYATFTANDVEAAFQIVAQENIDIVLSDVRMPGTSGVELLKRIKKLNPLKPKVILVTGYTEITDEEAKALGAEDVLRKPIDLEELQNCVSALRASLQDS